MALVVGGAHGSILHRHLHMVTEHIYNTLLVQGGGGDFGRGEFRGENFAVKKSGEIFAACELRAQSSLVYDNKPQDSWRWRNYPRRNCPLANSPPPPCTLANCVPTPLGA